MDEIIGRYQPEGAFAQGTLAQLGMRKERETGAEMQQLIGSGLYGTQAAAGVGTRWESLIGAPTRLTLEDLRMQQLSAAQQAKAGFVERIEDVYPDYATIAKLAMAAANRPTGGGVSYGGAPEPSPTPRYEPTPMPSYTAPAARPAATPTPTPIYGSTTQLGGGGTYYGAAAPGGARYEPGKPTWKPTGTKYNIYTGKWE